MVTRTLVLLEDWPELLRVLWREQHPGAHEQTALDFCISGPPAEQTKFLESVLNDSVTLKRKVDDQKIV